MKRVVLAVPDETQISEDLYDDLSNIEAARDFALDSNGFLFTFDKVLEESSLGKQSLKPY
jgi:hypothetical protein